MTSRLTLAALLALFGCTPHPGPPPPGPVSFTVGKPYQTGGEWRYPKEFNSYNMTGLSTVYGDDTPTFTADNELYDAQAFAAASPVLQLPAIVTVKNLVNGYTMQVRVNDRGPNIPGRVIEFTPRVAQALRMPPDGVVEVQVTLDTEKTAALDLALGQGPKLATAPLAAITAQPLGALGSAPQATQNLTPTSNNTQAAAPAPMSGALTQTQSTPGPLYVQIPGFGRMSDAYRIKARIYGMNAMIVPVYSDARTLYAINVGPYTSVASADAALQQILRLGISDPEIIVR